MSIAVCRCFGSVKMRLKSLCAVLVLSIATFSVLLLARSFIGGKPAFPCSSRTGFGLPLCFHLRPEISLLHDTVGNPDTKKGNRQDPWVDLDVMLVDYTPDFAVIVSLHNHASVASETIGNLLNQTRGIWEVILVFDDCQDGSLNVVHDLIKLRLQSDHFQSTQCHTAVLTRVRCIIQPTAVWETASDNIGFRVARPSQFYMLVQADMTAFEEAFNIKLAAPMDVYSDLFAVSGRCSHNLIERPSNKAQAGRCGTDIAQPLGRQELAAKRNTVFVRETVNRGPLLLRADRLLSLGFLDEKNFHLGDDDHNLMLRAFLNYGWKSAHFHVGFVAPLEYGSRRRVDPIPSSNSQKQYLQGRLNQVNRSDHQRMIEEIAKLPEWNQDRPISQQEIDDVIQQHTKRVRYLHICSQ